MRRPNRRPNYTKTEDIENYEIAPDYMIYKDGVYTVTVNGSTGKEDSRNTDSVTVIQYAIDQLASGGKIYFKKGTYLIDSSILPTSNITFQGSGAGTVFSDSVYIANRINISNADNVTLRDFKLKINYDGGDGGFGINLINSDNIVIDNIFIEGMNTNASPRWGIATRNCRNVKVVNCHIEHTEFEAMSFWEDTQAGIMANNTIRACGFGCVAERTGTQGCVITGNTITESTSASFQILLRNACNCVVSNNTIISDAIGGNGISLDSNANNNLVSGNVISSEGNSHYFAVGMKIDYHSKNNLISDNVITKVATGFLIAADSSWNTIKNNHIQGHAWGMQLKSKFNIIDGNSFVFCGAQSYTAAMKLFAGTSDNNRITNNLFLSPYRYAIMFEPGAGDTAINNLIKNNIINDPSATINDVLNAAAVLGENHIQFEFSGDWQIGQYIDVDGETHRIGDITTPTDTYTPATVWLQANLAGDHASGATVTGIKKLGRAIQIGGAGTQHPNYYIDNFIADAPAGYSIYDENNTDIVRGNIGADEFSVPTVVPDEPAIGSLWYNTATHVLSAWDGNSWETVTLT